MAKRRIHLTESRLYGLVEQAFNELDWKTHMNAADKMKTRKTQYAPTVDQMFGRTPAPSPIMPGISSTKNSIAPGSYEMAHRTNRKW